MQKKKSHSIIYIPSLFDFIRLFGKEYFSRHPNIGTQSITGLIFHVHYKRVQKYMYCVFYILTVNMTLIFRLNNIFLIFSSCSPTDCRVHSTFEISECNLLFSGKEFQSNDNLQKIHPNYIKGLTYILSIEFANHLKSYLQTVRHCYDIHI